MDRYNYEEIEPIQFCSANRNGVFYSKSGGKVAINLQRPDGRKSYTVLSYVLYTPEICGNFLSLARFVRTDIKYLFDKHKVLLKWRGDIVGQCKLISIHFCNDAESPRLVSKLGSLRLTSPISLEDLLYCHRRIPGQKRSERDILGDEIERD